MTGEELSIHALESSLKLGGYDCFRSGQALTIPCLGADVLTHNSEIRPLNNRFAVLVVFEARHAALGPPGIAILAVGYGDTEAAAARDAAGQWVIGVFPALLSYNSPDAHSCLVSRSEIMVEDPETGERYGWTVHLPPVLSRSYGTSDVEKEVNDDDVLGAIFEAINLRPLDFVFWLECFVVKHPDGSAEATCRYKNEDWAAGQQALIDWASGWPDTRGCMVSKRQFLLFERVSAGECARTPTLRRQ